MSTTTAPSKVLYFERLPGHWTERDLARAIAPAAVTKAVFLRKRNALFAGFSDATRDVVHHSAVQALVEVADVETAERVVEALAARPLVVAASEHHSSNNSLSNGHDTSSNNNDDDDSDTSDTIFVTASFSKNQELHDRAPPHARASGSRHHSHSHHHHARHGAERNEKPNRILLVTIQNPTYPITTDLVHSVFSGYGAVEKVVVFVKPIGLQTLVQFAALDDAVYAKSALAGLSIFPDCCSLQINFSNLPVRLAAIAHSRMCAPLDH